MFLHLWRNNNKMKIPTGVNKIKEKIFWNYFTMHRIFYRDEEYENIQASPKLSQKILWTKPPSSIEGRGPENFVNLFRLQHQPYQALYVNKVPLWFPILETLVVPIHTRILEDLLEVPKQRKERKTRVDWSQKWSCNNICIFIIWKTKENRRIEKGMLWTIINDMKANRGIKDIISPNAIWKRVKRNSLINHQLAEGASVSSWKDWANRCLNHSANGTYETMFDP